MHLILLSLLSAFAACASVSAKADDQAGPRPTLTTEQRENMAKAHEQMAACLRSNKSPNDCREELRQTCGRKDMPCGMMGFRWDEAIKQKSTGR